MNHPKSVWARRLRILILLMALGLIGYWFWYRPSQQPPQPLEIQFLP
ncbi:MAG: hypothetical protein SNJ72_00980 [Fimbriimonadales bacterium]